MTPTQDDDKHLWDAYSESYFAYARAQMELHKAERAYERARTRLVADEPKLLQLLRSKLQTSEWRVAVGLCDELTVPQLQQLFPELVGLASWGHGSVGYIRKLIHRLPREWVVERVEAEAEPQLAEGTYDEYRRFLELYSELDPNLTLRLARRAAAHPDPDIREAGEDYLHQALGAEDSQ